MILQILIRNFQSHKETILTLDPGVNALVGLTGAGKSVVFKALDWVFSNRPLGTEFRSWWGGDTQVEITLEEGQKVGRIRTDNDNCYYIDKKEFRAFGNGPPPQVILDVLNMSDVNFQAQADPSFLISNSAGEVARYLNKAAHLDSIDQTLFNIASVLRKEKEDLGQAKKGLEQAQGQLVLYDWLPEADEKLFDLERLQDKVVNLSSQKLGLTGVVEEYEQTAIVLVAIQNILFYSKEVDRLLDLHGQIERQNIGWEQLAAIIDQYEKVEKELTDLIPLEGMGSEVKKLVEIAEKIKIKRQEYYSLFNLVSDHDKAEKELDSYSWLPDAYVRELELEDLKNRIKESKEKKGKLQEIIDQIEEAAIVLKQTEISQKKLQEEFDKLMPNVCPLCDGTGGKKK